MGTPLRVLIVEDSEDDAALVVRELQRGGFAPTWERVETREALAAALEREAWDVVLSDYVMPRFSAPEALAVVMDRGLEVPFIIVSGTIGEDVAVEAVRAGAQDYILKDRLVRLPAAVGRELREAELRRAHAKSEEMLSETKERLDSAMQKLVQAEKLTALGELVAGVAHEINNPLAGILGYTQLVLRQELPPEVRRRLETVCSEAERAAKIVRNLLTFARKHPPERKYLGLNGIIEKTLELKAYHFRVSQIHVEKDLAPDLPMTMLDFHQIQQVLLNLVNNSEQAMAESGSGGTIRLTTRQTGDRIEARVSDTGPGIPSELQSRIFEPFFTTKKEGKGTGLGLSLCYGIIQEHGGTIRTESQPGAGATFILELPVLQDAGDLAKAASTPAALGRVTRKLSVFLIDDEPNVLGFLLDLLSSLGHSVDTASDVPEALRKIAANNYDLIITDMKMPHGTGRDIYRAVACRSAELAHRVIFTTGDGASQETQGFVREMGNEILLKPYRLEEVERVIANVIKS